MVDGEFKCCRAAVVEGVEASRRSFSSDTDAPLRKGGSCLSVGALIRGCGFAGLLLPGQRVKKSPSRSNARI
jgi:hypothetical protein